MIFRKQQNQAVRAVKNDRNLCIQNDYVLRQILPLTEKNNNQPNGVFFCIDENGKATDIGIVDEMLEQEQEITRQLIDAGVIHGFVVVDVDEDGENIGKKY